MSEAVPRTADRRMLRALLLTGLLVALVQAILVPTISVAFFAVQGWEAPAISVEGIMLGAAGQVLIAGVSAWISWRVLRHERRAGHPLTIIDAAAGPLAVTLVVGLPYVMLPFSVWVLSLTAVAAGLVLSVTGYYLSARRREKEDDLVESPAVAPPAMTVAPADDDADVPPIDWRLMRRRAFFLLYGSTIVSAAFAALLQITYIHPGGAGFDVLPQTIAMIVFFIVLSLPVLSLTLAFFNARPTLAWRRALGGVAISNAVLVPFGYAIIAIAAFDYVRGALWLGALVAGSLLVHPLVLVAAGHGRRSRRP